MKKIIKVEIYHDGDFYCGRCMEFDIFSQGATLDELPTVSVRPGSNRVRTGSDRTGSDPGK